MSFLEKLPIPLSRRLTYMLLLIVVKFLVVHGETYHFRVTLSEKMRNYGYHFQTADLWVVLEGNIYKHITVTENVS